ncbi:MAG TPA: response regulator [Rhodoglobus sp.]|jgi:DNA-binding NarL/FixJ family response regulator|nr:response regulator [Rhodoglobus sp.]HPG75181.1 response regulator [Rhodoglobus sp.]HQA23436.1 response regulator [Rhodoglobus sp.]HQI65304.1 response regulator [Rhodoglobus sp.]
MDDAERSRLRVIVADDDAFTRSLVADGLRSLGFEVSTAGTVTDAWSLVLEVDPHALISDLNFGPGDSGASLLARVHEEAPWVALVVLTSHQSPELAVPDAAAIPRDVVYLVKSQLREVGALGDAVHRAIGGEPVAQLRDPANALSLTSAQAEVLRLLASGASTRAVAEHRGTSVRAAETMLARLYSALGIDDDADSNPRVAAVQLWQQGRITVR